MSTLASIQERLKTVGQQHLLQFYSTLSRDQQASLLAQIADLDLESLPALVEQYVKHKPKFELHGTVAPAPYYPFNPASPLRPYDATHYRKVGEDLLRAGKVAAFVVAGGQGSRLGFEGPKGMYPASCILNKPLFQLFAEQLLAARRRYGRVVPWYIMTSPLNHQATTRFFAQQGYFGLGPENVLFFPQGVMPSLDIVTGQVLLSAPHEIATNPDGHGGAIKALVKSGSVKDMKLRGVEHLAYFQVDNPHVKICDPVFLGLHAAAPDSSAEMSSKMVPKASWDEKVGVFATVGGKLDVIEYSDLPPDLAKATTPEGSIKFNAGSIAIHVISVAFIERLTSDAAFSLPYHRAEKKIPCVDLASGKITSPAANNGVKLERFIFDALSRAKASIVYETDRVEEFAPIKNATGADSVESSKKLQTLRAARWLTAAGCAVPTTSTGEPDCVIELSPLTAAGPDDLRAAKLPAAIKPGERVVL